MRRKPDEAIGPQWRPPCLASRRSPPRRPRRSGPRRRTRSTVALVSHAPTLDPHMHFERVGVLVTSTCSTRCCTGTRSSSSSPRSPRRGRRSPTPVGVQDPQGRALPQRRDPDAGGRQVLVRPGARPDQEVAPVRQHPRDQGSEGGRRGHRAHHHRQALPAPARAARLLPHRPQEAHRGGRRPGLRHDVARRHRARGSSSSGSGTSSSGSRPSTSTGAASRRSSTSTSGRSPRSRPRWPRSRRRRRHHPRRSPPTSSPSSRPTRRPTSPRRRSCASTT